MDDFHDPLTVKRTDELQGQQHRDDAGVLYEELLMKICGLEIDWPPRILARDLLPRLFKHVRSIVDADKVYARIQDRIEHQQCGRGRAADVVEIGARPGEILA